MNKAETDRRDGLRRMGRGLLDACGQPVVAVALSLLIGAVIILLAGENPLRAYSVMLTGAFGNGFYLSATFSRATPIIMGGLAVCVAWASGYEAMGGEGQMIFGALSGALVAAYCPGPGIVRILAAMLTAMLLGAAWSMLSGWLYDRFSVTFIISTLMMNYIANNFASYLTSYVVRDPTAPDLQSIQTMKIDEAARLPRVFAKLSLHWGFVLALLLAVLVFLLMRKTRFGYTARMNGLNPRFAQYGGVGSRRTMYLALAISGMLAGLGGSFEALGAKYRYIDQMIFNTAYAWTGMVAALLAGFNPFGTVAASILLAGLATGGSAMQRSTSIPVEAANMIEGTIMLLMSVKLLRLVSVRRKARRRVAEGGERA